MYLENVEGFAGEGDLFTKFGIEIRDQATFVLAKRRWDDMVLTSGGTFTQDKRPSEGDLLYFEKTGSIFEIKLVEFQDPFYQANKLYVFRLQCELFEYSSEKFDTGITELDNVQDDNSLDMFLYQLLNEEGDLILFEEGGSLILEEYAEQRTNANTDNEDFSNINTLDDILDFSEVNPFGELG